MLLSLLSFARSRSVRVFILFNHINSICFSTTVSVFPSPSRSILLHLLQTVHIPTSSFSSLVSSTITLYCCSLFISGELAMPFLPFMSPSNSVISSLDFHSAWLIIDWYYSLGNRFRLISIIHVILRITISNIFFCRHSCPVAPLTSTPSELSYILKIKGLHRLIVATSLCSSVLSTWMLIRKLSIIPKPSTDTYTAIHIERVL